MAKKYYKKFNKMLPRKPKKHRFTTAQKVAWSMMTATILVYVAPEAITQLYNYINRGDSTEIKLPQKNDLFPENEKNDKDKKEQDKIDKENKNYAYTYLKDMIRPQIEEKLRFEIEGDFDILGVFEINMRSDAFSSKDTELKILIKPQNGKVFCVDYNNNFAQVEIEKNGSDSDAVSSLVAHLQDSSIKGFEINTEFFEDVSQNLSEKGIVFVGTTQTYIEKNGEKSYLIPVFYQNGDQIVMKTYKGLQSEIEKADKTPEGELANMLYGDESLMQIYTNSKQQDLEHINNVINKIRNEKTDDNNKNNDLFPEDFYSDINQSFTKG